MAPVWTRLIRFRSVDGRILNGEPILPTNDYDLGQMTVKDGLQARVIVGEDIFAVDGSTTVTDEVVDVERLIGPLDAAKVPVIRCIGLNYAKHSMCCQNAPATVTLLIKPQSKRPVGLLLRSHSSS